MTTPRPLIVYHHPCADGFSAAWCFWRKYGPDADYHPAKYNAPMPDVRDRDVFLVDFSWPVRALEAALGEARSITVIDHHKSAMLDMTDWLMTAQTSRKQEAFAQASGATLKGTCLGPHGNLTVTFDMNRSGSTMAWDFLFPSEPRPLLLGHIEDRDLWRFKLPNTREIQSAVFAHPYDFPTWDRLMRADQAELLKMTVGGAAIDRKHKKDLAEIITAAARTMTIGGYLVSVVNVPYTMASDAGERLAEGRAAAIPPSNAGRREVFVATYYDTADHRHFSLRSLEDGADVSVIAKRYGGGGHARAAGFRVTRDHELARA